MLPALPQRSLPDLLASLDSPDAVSLRVVPMLQEGPPRPGVLLTQSTTRFLRHAPKDNPSKMLVKPSSKDPARYGSIHALALLPGQTLAAPVELKLLHFVFRDSAERAAQDYGGPADGRWLRYRYRYRCGYRCIESRMANLAGWPVTSLPVERFHAQPKNTTAGGSRRRSSASGSRPKPTRSTRGSRAALAPMLRSALRRGCCGTPLLYMVASPTRGASGRARGRGQSKSCSLQPGK